jgi:hypothetical protein
VPPEEACAGRRQAMNGKRSRRCSDGTSVRKSGADYFSLNVIGSDILTRTGLPRCLPGVNLAV